MAQVLFIETITEVKGPIPLVETDNELMAQMH